MARSHDHVAGRVNRLQFCKLWGPEVPNALLAVMFDLGRHHISATGAVQQTLLRRFLDHLPIAGGGWLAKVLTGTHQGV